MIQYIQIIHMLNKNLLFDWSVVIETIYHI